MNEIFCPFDSFRDRTIWQVGNGHTIRGCDDFIDHFVSVFERLVPDALVNQIFFSLNRPGSGPFGQILDNGSDRRCDHLVDNLFWFFDHNIIRSIKVIVGRILHVDDGIPRRKIRDDGAGWGSYHNILRS